MSPPQGNWDGCAKDNFTSQTIPKEETEIRHSSSWIYYSLGAAALLAVCNTTMSDLSLIGVEGLLYLSPGNLLCGMMYCSLSHMFNAKPEA